MNYVQSLNVFGTEAKQIPCITASGAPTETTEGAVGSLYMDKDTNNIYKCVSALNGVYVWENAAISPDEAIKKFCPEFTTTGDWAVCNPVEDSKLNIKTTFRPVIPAGFAPSPAEPEDLNSWTRSGGTLYQGSRNFVDLKAIDNIKVVRYTHYDKNTGNTSIIEKYAGYSFSLPAGTYTVSGEYCGAEKAFIGLHVNKANKANGDPGEYVFNASIIWDAIQPACSITVNDDDIIHIYQGGGSTVATAKRVFANVVNIMVEPGESKSSYVPYNTNELTVDFGQQVYGGTYNWTTGVLTIEIASKTFDGSPDERWQSSVDNGHPTIFTYEIHGDRAKYPARSDLLPHDYNSLSKGLDAFYLSNTGLTICRKGYTTLEEHLALLEEFPFTIVYALKVPIEVQLTPHEFRALSGENVCHSNIGETTVTCNETINAALERITNAITALGANV